MSNLGITRVLNLTHNDLDGVSSAVAIKAAHPDAHVTVVFCTYDTIHEEFAKGLSSKLPYDRIVLTDISILAPGAANLSERENFLVNNLIPREFRAYVAAGGEVVALDHHAPACLKMLEGYKNLFHPDSICRKADEEGVLRAGSELAGVYYARRRGSSAPAASVKAILGWMEAAGAYDVFRKGPEFETSKLFAMALELMDDNMQALADMETMVAEASLAYAAGAEPDWEECALGTTLHRYVEKVPEVFEKQVEKALSGAIHHSKQLTEVYVGFFPSLVGEAIYQRTGGVALIRYAKDRNRARKVSGRRAHDGPDLHLGEVMARFGKGGGHAQAAGVSIDLDRFSIDDVVSGLLDELALRGGVEKSRVGA